MKYICIHKDRTKIANRTYEVFSDLSAAEDYCMKHNKTCNSESKDRLMPVPIYSYTKEMNL